MSWVFNIENNCCLYKYKKWITDLWTLLKGIISLCKEKTLLNDLLPVRLLFMSSWICLGAVAIRLRETDCPLEGDAE